MKLTAPSFWQTPAPTMLSNLLLPFSKVTGFVARQRQTQPSLRLPVPVLCCGNITVGGTGKTPMSLHLLQKLIQRGRTPHALTRGHGGRSKKTGLISPTLDRAVDVGDETILLARLAPTWRGPDRRANALRAIEAGADCLVMDDGLQDPSLHKDLSLLVIDGPAGLGNQRLLPAGPLRESLPDLLPRLHATVILGDDRQHIAGQLPPSLPVLKGTLSPGTAIQKLRGYQLIAFAGIGRPQKFFSTLQDAGLTLLRTLTFPDHHIYSARELKKLAQLAHMPETVLVTTEKDFVKLPPLFQNFVVSLDVEPRWSNPRLMDELLDHFLAE
ncbi:tetraacyldisaccharide 4'-kinase [Parasaccharibacter sp. TMW 2.1891]|uniref:Tetraacyldisaccharide 4'-kinase n=2 Tax=Acetobacterales TaxID=3120395 RepID=A0ABR9MQ21_9PROT|nr:tetraacyldisaccharide 4'-kinase [Parasaccharibacter sp. TMW 2.1884]MBE1723375.1 tetraacyldisaccharide 4'-kinase [Bombella apis]MCL1513460.1 tetraacyldisaccharide 4'-kinase [Parasaccharibacter sp. TMW 2.1891]MCL1515001.1 tetraacyldisaccharide 4'-kinase [Parasaccharibacter sp. TMW2.1890]QGT75165.1 tetraacyldisaccharide 4'-kinase [Bombella sp. ESL0368]MBR9730154.1 tetraacyldisaccharide 4'-kinase [Bombella apis]